jgi:hypothetical protein
MNTINENQRNPFLALIEEWDDKTQAILTLGTIAVAALIFMNDPESVVSACIGGVSGLAMGRKI